MSQRNAYSVAAFATLSCMVSQHLCKIIKYHRWY